MRQRFFGRPLALFLGLAIACAAGVCALQPRPVAPGAPEGVALIAGRCPTFHWTAADGIEDVELVIYRLPAGNTEGPPDRVLSLRLPASAQGWTPALPQCLEPGAQYAWTVGADNAWSEARLFEVSARPTVSEVERALAVLGAYLEGESGVESDRDEADDPTSTPAAKATVLATGPPPLPPVPVAALVAAGETAALIVDGTVEATSFSGDGSGLTGVGTVATLFLDDPVMSFGFPASANNTDVYCIVGPHTAGGGEVALVSASLAFSDATAEGGLIAASFSTDGGGTWEFCNGAFGGESNAVDQFTSISVLCRKSLIEGDTYHFGIRTQDLDASGFTSDDGSCHQMVHVVTD